MKTRVIRNSVVASAIALLFVGCTSTSYPFALQNLSQKKVNNNAMLVCNDAGIPLEIPIGEYQDRKILEDQQCTLLQYDTDGKETVWFYLSYFLDDGQKGYFMQDIKIESIDEIHKRTFYFDNEKFTLKYDGKLIRDYLEKNNIEL